MLRMIGIADRYQQRFVSARSSAVLRRAAPFAGNADGMSVRFVGALDALREDLVSPAIAEVVSRLRRRAR
jgi:hypothetical protein